MNKKQINNNKNDQVLDGYVTNHSSSSKTQSESTEPVACDSNVT